MKTIMNICVTSVFCPWMVFVSFAYSEDCRHAVELYNKGTLSKDCVEKENYFLEAIPLCTDPDVLSKLYNNLADVYETEGDLSKALVYYKKAIEINKDLITPYMSVGDIFSKLGDYFSAYVMYDKALKINPDEKDARNGKEKSEEAFKKKMVIYFDKNSSEIPDNYIYRLQIIGELLKNNPSTASIRITGHTCDLGSKAYNRRLSRKRAEVVAEYLKLNYPVKIETLVAAGKDKLNPILPDKDDESRVLNRRVEILLK
ncbi:MAG: OmpA family protein [Proteobacteria bacterium]|nr:OmpA family protein [Pseudomonadota bacterium]